MTMKSNQTARFETPRTVATLMPWLDDKIACLMNAISRSERNGSPRTGDPMPYERAGPIRPDHAFAGSLYQAVLHLEDVLSVLYEPRVSSEIALTDFVRAMLLTGNGEKFEPTVMAAIRDYCETFDEIRRYSELEGVPQDLREDVVAGYSRVLARCKRDLQLLSITMQDVPPGTKLDLARHLVVEKIPTNAESKADSVYRCHAPAFTWVSANGTQRIVPARVAAYVLTDRLGSSYADAHSPKDEAIARVLFDEE